MDNCHGSLAKRREWRSEWSSTEVSNYIWVSDTRSHPFIG